MSVFPVIRISTCPVQRIAKALIKRTGHIMGIEEILDLSTLRVFLVTLCITLIYWRGTQSFDLFKRLGIPYRKPLIPFFGNLIAYNSKTVAENDLFLLKEFKGQLNGAFQGMKPVIEVADADFFNKVATKSFSSFRNRRHIVLRAEEQPILTRRMGLVRDEHWKHLRTLIGPTMFTTGQLKRMHSTIADCATKFTEHIASNDSTDRIPIKQFCSGFAMDVISRTAFGLDMGVQDVTNHMFVQHAATFFGIPRVHGLRATIQSAMLFLKMLLPDKLIVILNKLFGLSYLDPESVRYFEQLVDQVVDQVQQDQHQTAPSFISLCSEKMVDLKKVDPSTLRENHGRVWSTSGMTREEVLANAALFLTAGFETTATSVQFFCYNMAMNPDIQEKLYGEIQERMLESEGETTYESIRFFPYLEQCCKESLRLFPPLLRFDREANTDAEVNGVFVPKGVTVIALAYAIHYNSKYWPEPEKYNPDRFSPENLTEIQKHAYLSFGSGYRRCPAEALAMHEIKAAGFSILSKFKLVATRETPQMGDIPFRKGTEFLQTELHQPITISAVLRE